MRLETIAATNQPAPCRVVQIQSRNRPHFHAPRCALDPIPHFLPTLSDSLRYVQPTHLYLAQIICRPKRLRTIIVRMRAKLCLNRFQTVSAAASLLTSETFSSDFTD